MKDIALIHHVYICYTCGGGGEEHYLTLGEGDEAPDEWSFGEYDQCTASHDEDCKADDETQGR